MILEEKKHLNISEQEYYCPAMSIWARFDVPLSNSDPTLALTGQDEVEAHGVHSEHKTQSDLQARAEQYVQ